MSEGTGVTGYTQTFRGVVYPWHCDHLGHMNVQHYVGMFDQGTFHLLLAAGFRWNHDKGDREGFVDAKHTLEFKAEQRVGSLVVIEGGIVRVGTKSMTMYQRMKNAQTGVVAATSEIVVVYFDMVQRQARELPEKLRKGFAAIMVDKDD